MSAFIAWPGALVVVQHEVVYNFWYKSWHAKNIFDVSFCFPTIALWACSTNFLSSMIFGFQIKKKNESKFFCSYFRKHYAFLQLTLAQYIYHIFKPFLWNLLLGNKQN